MVFGLRIEKWRDRKYSLYKFTSMPLMDKKITNKKKKYRWTKKNKSPKSVQRRKKKENDKKKKLKEIRKKEKDKKKLKKEIYKLKKKNTWHGQEKTKEGNL